MTVLSAFASQVLSPIVTRHPVPLHDATGEKTSRLCLEYSLYLAALPPICWYADLTSCLFVVESAAFNGPLLLAAWRFRANSERGQAHARRLFLISLVYLPVFFGCLLMHQKREPEDRSADGRAAPLEATARHAVFGRSDACPVVRSGHGRGANVERA